MRGKGFHTLLVEKAAEVFLKHRFQIERECPRRLPDGSIDFLDILAVRDRLEIAVEVETTPRNAVHNISMAMKLDIPLMMIVPNKTVRNTVLKRIDGQLEQTGQQFWILLPDELPQVLTNCFPYFPTANNPLENKKQIPMTAIKGRNRT